MTHLEASRIPVTFGVNTAVVVPCFNEEKRFDEAAFLRAAEEQPGVVFILVNDGSQDGTASVLARLAKRDPTRFRALNLPENVGKAEAVRVGVLDALRLDPRRVAFWDADLSTPLELIPLFEATLEERPAVELVMGARVKLLGWAVVRSRIRHYAGRVFATLVSVVLGLAVYDTQCGAKMFRKTPELDSLFQEPFLSRWIFDVEILARMIQRWGGDRAPAEARIYELPLPRWIHDRDTRLTLWDFARSVLELYAIRRRYLRPAGARSSNTQGSTGPGGGELPKAWNETAHPHG